MPKKSKPIVSLTLVYLCPFFTAIVYETLYRGVFKLDRELEEAVRFIREQSKSRRIRKDTSPNWRLERPELRYWVRVQIYMEPADRKLLMMSSPVLLLDLLWGWLLFDLSWVCCCLTFSGIGCCKIYLGWADVRLYIGCATVRHHLAFVALRFFSGVVM